MADEPAPEEPDLFERVTREPRLSDKVAEMMRQTILSRQLAPGTPLPSERELGEQFGVSRTVIREAVRAPRRQGDRGGSLRQRASRRVGRRGDSARVAELVHSRGAAGVPKVHEVRSTIEVEMAGLAAERRTDDELRAMREAHARFEAFSEDVEKAAAATSSFTP